MATEEKFTFVTPIRGRTGQFKRQILTKSQLEQKLNDFFDDPSRVYDMDDRFYVEPHNGYDTNKTITGWPRGEHS